MASDAFLDRRVQHDLETWFAAMGCIGVYEDGGFLRQQFTSVDRQQKDLIGVWMREIGLTVREDDAGNLFGRLNGEHEIKPAVLTGSHIDSVRAGGAYDGMLGVLAPLAALRELVH